MNEDQHHLLNFSTPNLQASSSSSFSCHIFFDSTQDQTRYYHRELQQLQEANNQASHEASYDIENESDNCLNLSLWKKEYTNENQISEKNISVKWMSSKMRLMQKMKNSDRAGVGIQTHDFQDDQKQPSSPIETENSSNSSSNNSNNIPVRVCADCSTTKTPLWRSGPRGPKSLCNACGIRQRKARRAMAAAAAAANGTIVATETSSMKPKVQLKDKKSNKGRVAQYKKRSKLAIPSDHSRKKLCFEDFLISLSKNLAFHSVFPQDEKEAAILLMALSCGLVHD